MRWVAESEFVSGGVLQVTVEGLSEKEIAIEELR
jgi:hypothetical protein